MPHIMYAAKENKEIPDICVPLNTLTTAFACEWNKGEHGSFAQPQAYLSDTDTQVAMHSHHQQLCAEKSLKNNKKTTNQTHSSHTVTLLKDINNFQITTKNYHLVWELHKRTVWTHRGFPRKVSKGQAVRQHLEMEAHRGVSYIQGELAVCNVCYNFTLSASIRTSRRTIQRAFHEPHSFST